MHVENGLLFSESRFPHRRLENNGEAKLALECAVLQMHCGSFALYLAGLAAAVQAD